MTILPQNDKTNQAQSSQQVANRWRELDECARQGDENAVTKL